MTIIFFGSSLFSVPVLQKLIDSKIDIAGVVTKSDKPVGRHQILTPNPVKTLAQKHTIPVFPSPELRRGVRGEVGLVAAYGKIIPRSVLNTFNNQVYNIHPSLLPKYRGPSPLQQQILDGITETGVTLMQLDSEMDHGPIVAQQKDTIHPDDTTQTLGTRLFSLGTNLLLFQLRKEVPWEAKSQNHSQVTYTKKLTRDSGFVPWQEFDPKKLDVKFRALYPWPGVWTIDPSGKRVKLVSLNPIMIQFEGKTPQPYAQTPRNTL